MNELIAVCDLNGNYTGENLPRSEIHKKELWHRTAHVQVFDDGGRTLLQLRAAGKEAFPNKLDISAAGHVDAGETVIHAALRELKEELGLSLDESRLEYIEDTVSEQVLMNGCLDREIQSFYIARISDEEKRCVRAQESEVQSVLWFTGRELELALRECVERFTPNDEEYPTILRLLGVGFYE